VYVVGDCLKGLCIGFWMLFDLLNQLNEIIKCVDIMDDGFSTP
jgi:hypothetical protein